jgi:endonuclease/exonuclease/phosphatase family metal-dependent hydrolase
VRGATAEADEWTGRRVPVSRRGGSRAGAWFAGLLLAGVSVVVGCRIADTDGITPVPQLLAFLPWLLAPTAVALLFAALTRWRLGLVWGVAVLGALAWYIEPYGKTTHRGRPGRRTPRTHLERRVRPGHGRADRRDQGPAPRPRLRPGMRVRVRGEAGAGLRKGQEQEGRTGREREPRQMRGTRAPTPIGRRSKAAGSDGSVILSRHPLKPAAGIPATMGMPGATADVNGHEIRLQLAHPMPPLPTHLSTWREELSDLRDYAAANRARPTVLAGDFNASQDHAAFRRILDAGFRDAARLTGDARTPSWPARTAPPLGAQIDHVLVSRDFAANRARFLDLGQHGPPDARRGPDPLQELLGQGQGQSAKGDAGRPCAGGTAHVSGGWVVHPGGPTGPGSPSPVPSRDR